MTPRISLSFNLRGLRIQAYENDIQILKLCVKYGYASSIQDAFNKYLIEAYNKTRSTSKGLSYQECIELILQSKGIPILAHPKSLELPEKEFLILLKELVISTT